MQILLRFGDFQSNAMSENLVQFLTLLYCKLKSNVFWILMSGGLCVMFCRLCVCQTQKKTVLDLSIYVLCYIVFVCVRKNRDKEEKKTAIKTISVMDVNNGL